MTTASIFVSSVQKELAEERRAVKAFVEGDALLRRFFTVFLFEDLPAADVQADAIYLDEVDRAELHIGIFGNECSYEDAEGVSPTEREFDRALERTGRLRTKPFDATACPEAMLTDLSVEKLEGFLARAQAVRGYSLPPGTTMEAALTHLNLLDGQHPSHAAVLLFGQRPQRFLLTSEVKCLHFHGTEVQKPIPSYQVYKGTVFELVDQALDFVMSKIASRVGTRAKGPVAPVTYELPRQAVAEAIVNAVAHRDYTSNASVQVMLFADRLEVWNPGELPRPLTFERLRRPPASGLPTTGEVAPEVRLARILAGEMTRQQIQEALGLRHEDHFRKAYRVPALEAGLIEMTIPDKPRSSKQRYRLTPKGTEARKER